MEYSLWNPDGFLHFLRCEFVGSTVTCACPAEWRTASWARHFRPSSVRFERNGRSPSEGGGSCNGPQSFPPCCQIDARSVSQTLIPRTGGIGCPRYVVTMPLSPKSAS